MVGFYIFRTDFADVSKQVSRIGIVVLANASLLNVEARKAEKLLLETAELLGRELAQKDLLCIGTVAWIALAVFYLFHSSLVPFASYVEAFTKVQCINAHLLIHDDHHIIGRLVIDKQLAISVGNRTSSRILDALKESIGVGTYLEVFAEQLQGEETNQIDNDDDRCCATNHVFTLLKLIVSVHSATYFLGLRTFSTNMISNREAAKLTPILMAISLMWK